MTTATKKPTAKNAKKQTLTFEQRRAKKQAEVEAKRAEYMTRYAELLMRADELTDAEHDELAGLQDLFDFSDDDVLKHREWFKQRADRERRLKELRDEDEKESKSLSPDVELEKVNKKFDKAKEEREAAITKIRVFQSRANNRLRLIMRLEQNITMQDAAIPEFASAYAKARSGKKKEAGVV